MGAALARVAEAGGPTRDELFLQTKFTYAEGQDARLPYDPAADLPTQVRQSFASSLEHMGLDAEEGRLDSYVLHGPRSGYALTPDDLLVWQTMEELRAAGRVAQLGVSNVHPGQLAALVEHAGTPPAFVQNRCFARTGWDREVRAICRETGAIYQGFSLLTANRAELARPEVRQIAERHERTVPQVAFRFALHLGMICLTGTTDPHHMRQDLAAADFDLSDDEVATIETIAT